VKFGFILGSNAMINSIPPFCIRRFAPLILGACLLSVTVRAAEPESASAPREDRVGFPRDYQVKYEVVRSFERDDKIVTIYANAPAASITNASQLPYPNGSVLVMETAAVKKGADGKPERDAQGKVIKEKVTGMHVMRREKGFGEGYGENRSGEWEYVEYRADGSHLTPPEKSASCSQCHIKAGKERDFVYRGRLAPAEKK
jgi:hypothetical protein